MIAGGKGKTKPTSGKGKKATGLKEFLSNLATDPRKLGEFLHEPENTMSGANLSEADKAALRSGVPGMIYARLTGVPRKQAFAPPVTLIKVTPEPAYMKAPPQYVVHPPHLVVHPPQHVVYPPQFMVQPPQYVVQPPQFVVQPPQYVVQPPQFVVQPPQYVVYPPQFVVQPPQYVVYPPQFVVQAPPYYPQ